MVRGVATVSIDFNTIDDIELQRSAEVVRGLACRLHALDRHSLLLNVLVAVGHLLDDELLERLDTLLDINPKGT